MGFELLDNRKVNMPQVCECVYEGSTESQRDLCLRARDRTRSFVHRKTNVDKHLMSEGST